MTRLLAVIILGLWSGVALADKKPTPTEYTSEGGRYSATFPAKVSTKDDSEQVATSAGNLSVVTSRCEAGGAVYSVTYTDYPTSFGIVSPKDILDGVVNGMKGSDGKVATTEDVVVGVAKGRSVTITAGDNTVRAKVLLIDERLYIVMVTGKKDTTRVPEADKFLDSFTLTK